MNVYTDGAYSPLLECGGIGIVFENHGQYQKKFKNTTNQRMELMAAIVALESIIHPTEVNIYSDSAYLVKTINDNWKRNCNIDLWNRLDKAILKHNKVNFYWIKGHDINEQNNLADKLAQSACRLL
jgi:ribonuclease HI